MVANEKQGPVYEFQIDTSTGTFSAIQGSPFQANVGSQAYVCTNLCGGTLIADPLGRFLYYQYSYASNGLTSLSVNPQTGALSNAGNYSGATYEVSAEPQGRYLYWNGGDGSSNAIDGLAVSSAGQFSPTPGQPYVFSGQESYGNPAVTANYVFAIDYLESGNPSTASILYEWTIDPATGTLTQTGNHATLQQAANPVITPNGKFIYAQQLYFSNNEGYYETVPIQVNSDGSFTVLTQDIQQTPSNGPNNVWMSPNGNFLLEEVNGQIWDYQINQSTGALTLVQKYTNISSSLVAIDPAVQFVFMSPQGPNNVAGTTLTAYSVDPTTGALTPVPNSTVDTQVTPIGLAVVSPQ